ncbi:hypothetical protein CC030809_00163 [Synechococcus phage S-CAM7]|uniref:Peptidase S74 domain-containing protein n=1 Tax=Synechococcus phage S-CAM7 TaxID=1883368 RepID=A0A1D8KUM6_9CAUD|nr:hypothetical protein S420910_165 [Synechococcus phage S-CAM7]QLF86219.1 hypothetical protein CC030809_00163 [Synechococcus phage S-CAM7]
MSYEINEVVIIDGSRNIVNAGVGTFTKVHPAELEVGTSGLAISDVLNETDLSSDSASALPTQHAVKAYVDAAISTVQSDIDANELASDNAESALSGRLDTLEADPTTATALAAVQADVDANELASDNAESALSGRLDTLEADPTTQTLLTAEASARTSADSALSGRLDTLEADPTTQTLLTAEATTRASADASETSARQVADNALSGRLDTLEADPTTQTLLDSEASTRSAADVLLNAAVSNANLAIAANEDHIDNLATLSGVAKDAENLGSFTGSTISDNITIKAALQDLETGVDNALGGGAAASSVETVTLSTDATHYLTFVNADNGTGTQENLYTDAGIQYNPSSDILTVGEVVISGNLTVNGTQTIFDTTVIQAQDKNITLGVTTAPTDAGADGGGLTLMGTTNKTFNWINATDAFTASEHISIAAGKEYRIDGVKVIESGALGASIVSSSLQTVGTLASLTVSGDITANGNITGDNFTDITGIRTMHSQFITIDNVNLTASATELNYLDGSTPGAATAGNAVVLDSSKDVTGINQLQATSLVGELTGNADSSDQVKTVRVTTNSAHYLTFVDGDNSSQTNEELNTSLLATFNPSDGSLVANKLTASSNFYLGLTEVTASGTELNYLDGSLTGTAVASKAVVLDASKDIAGINNIDIAGDLVGDGASNISGINTVTAAGKMYALSYTSTSDASLKENVEKIEGAVEKVEAIRGVTFDWKDGSGSTAGIIAQEVEAVMPMLVESGEIKRVDYNGLVGLLIEAVKELSAEVKELKAN